MSNLMEGKLAVITGGSRGIGRAIAEAYIKEGARVVIPDINLEVAEQAVKEMGEDKAFTMRLNVAEKANVDEVVEKIWNEIGPVDVWVNNAGISEDVPFENLLEEKWDLIVDVDLKGTFLCSQAIYKKMKERRAGKIINIASKAGERGGRVSGAHYSAAKGGVLTLTKVLALNGGEFGITANAITPGLILSQMAKDLGWDKKEHKDIPLGRLGTIQDVANVAVFLGSYLSDYVNGDTIRVNGGMYMG